MAEEKKNVTVEQEVKDSGPTTDIYLVDQDEKRFKFNVDSGLDKDGNKILFTFTGPEVSSLGLIYDAAHRILMEVASIIKKRAENLKPKSPEEVKPEVEEVK